MKKSFFFFVIVAAGILALILSGCFQMQTTISFDSYIQTTPFSSISHIYIFIKSINANNNSIGVPNLNQEYDLVPLTNNNFYTANQIPGLQNLAFSGNGPFSINSISMNIGPVATVVTGNGSQYVIPVATMITVPFYNYNNQSMQQAPLQINAGQNKTALILWNLSQLFGSSQSPITLSASGFDMSNLITFNIIYKASNVTLSDPSLYTGSYPAYRFAEIYDSLVYGNKTYSLTAQGYWNTLTDAYDFTFYPFAAPTSNGYTVSFSIKSATETFLPSATVTSIQNTVTIHASNITITPTD
ncbi:MAG: hypothetical protein ACP5UJ_04260 [Athalassotoga sp.]|uniref:hypothetical protein n=1 Tax=Athalassotoga sp. TaxID=2022597 RepID=UPI003D07E336